jgi:hypothetical protein
MRTEKRFGELGIFVYHSLCSYTISDTGGIQMLPSLRSHREYIHFVNKHLETVHVPKAHEKVFEKLKLLDLTSLRLLFLPLYCLHLGRPGYAPEDMMRSLVAMVLCGITSPDTWVNNYLRDTNGFYAIASGFLPGEVPSVGCLYDFISRILSLPRFCREKHIRPKQKKLTRSEKKQLRDDKEKVTKRHIRIITKLAERFERIQANSEDVYVPAAEKMVNDILELCCVNESQSRKMMHKEHLNISADGTKLKVHGNR